ncbi:MAG: hypothetical protein JNK15_09045 [Planctomycetes bacterium]|nr:hypothetical protein [Planctomycetota bacterium]
MQRLEVLGHWFSPFAPWTLPRPQALVGGWRPAERDAVLRYLRAGKVLVRYPEASFCRFDCGETALGTSDLTDGRHVWPEGLAHYVECHDVRLPESFVAHVVAAGGEVAPFRLPKATFGLYDRGPWLAWSAEQNASPDLVGFEVPDEEVQERIARDLAGVAYDAILLCRGSTREVVLAVGGGLELRHVQAGGRAPRRFAGWHEWPTVGRATDSVAGSAASVPAVRESANAAAAKALAALRKPKPAAGQSFADFFAARKPKDAPPAE